MALDFLPIYIRYFMDFSANWYHHHAKVTYDEETMTNPMKRFELKKKTEITKLNAFPEIFGNEQNVIKPNLGYGVVTIPKIWGCRIQFQDHMDPVAHPLLKPEEDPLKLKVPDVQERMGFLFDEIDKYVEMGYNKKEIGFPDMQGPLNVSLRLVGDNRMLGLIARKNKDEVVNHILDIASDVYIETYQTLRKELNHPLESNWGVSGCSYYYLKPEKWVKYILPVIKKCEVLGKGVRLHHCGEADTKKVETYAKYQWNDCEFGFGSDLKTVRKLFIHPKLGPLNISCRISPYRLLNQSADQVTKDIEWIISQISGGPTSIGAIGVPFNTPRENIMAAYNAVQAYNAMKEKETEEEDW